jgi:hypothetical protein
MLKSLLCSNLLLRTLMFVAIVFPFPALAASTAAVSLSGDRYLDSIFAGIKWGSTAVTYSFPAQANYYEYTSEPSNMFEWFIDRQQISVRVRPNPYTAALANYTAVSNLTFSELTESTNQHATLRYAESDAPSTAWGYYPSTAAQGGDSWYNHSSNRFDNPILGTYAYETMLHETGHTVGNKHPHEVAGSFPAMPTDRDSLEYTVMSYHSYVGSSLGGYTNSSNSYPQSLMMYDIAALQYNYGANFTTNSGPTVYAWSPTTAELFINGVGQGAPVGNIVFMTLWDGGGIDTFDLSNYATSTNIDLQPGKWSTFSTKQIAKLSGTRSAIGNVANALIYKGNQASLIENVIGGSFNDIIVGNDANNTFTGGSGNDSLQGGAGNNTAVYSGPQASYLVAQNSDNSWTVSDQRSGSPDGTDALRSIQVLRFSDGSVPISTSTPVNHAPVALNDSYGVDMNTSLSITASSGVLANDSDQDGNQMTALLVVQPQRGTLNLNSNGSFTYVPATDYFGTDSFIYKANDGALDSSTATVTINVQQVIPPDTALPAVSIVTPENGSTVSGTATITATASDNIGVVRVELFKDGALFGTDTSSPFSWSWPTTADIDGLHSLVAKAYDAAGNVGNSAGISVNVSNAAVSDTVAPAIAITSPANETKIKGNGTVSISVSAVDSSGIASIVIITDGVVKKTCTLVTTCNYSWSGKTISVGSHTISTIVTDNSPARNQNGASIVISK